MRFFHEIAFLLMPLLVVGQLGLELEVGTLKFLPLASCYLSMFFVPVLLLFAHDNTLFIQLYRTGMEASWILQRNGNATSLDNARCVSTHIQQGLA